VKKNTKPTNAGWWYTYPFEKYERQMGLFFPTEWKNKIHVPNHQPVMVDMSIVSWVSKPV